MNHFGKFLFGALLSISCALPAQAADTLMMATTTSTQDSGLLEYVAPVFKKETGIDLKWVAVGTGKALEISKNCDADVLLVHAPDVEKKFIDDGYGIDRRQVMYNDFVIVGPKSDPAKIAGKTTGEALKAIYDAKAGFVSRQKYIPQRGFIMTCVLHFIPPFHTASVHIPSPTAPRNDIVPSDRRSRNHIFPGNRREYRMFRLRFPFFRTEYFRLPADCFLFHRKRELFPFAARTNKMRDSSHP